MDLLSVYVSLCSFIFIFNVGCAAEYIKCYRESEIRWHNGSRVDRLTGLPVCRDRCKSRPNTFTGIRGNGPGALFAQCYCGDTHDHNHVPSGCNFDCGGETCGGYEDEHTVPKKFYLSVYATCEGGKYSTDCDKTCPEHCLDDVCYISNGNCLDCDGGFVGDKCDRCEDGMYGSDCDIPCPVGCKDSVCDVDGTCINGCKAGYYGDKCNTPCPINCKNNVCDVTSGDCTDGCDDGYYDPQCHTPCPANCNGNKCASLTGDCTDGCDQGFYSFKCNQRCPINCKGNICNFVTGNCHLGCIINMYGPNCTQSCPMNCDRICLQEGGDCQGCVDGWYGSRCDVPCSIGCQNNQCTFQGGSCTVGCLEGYHGVQCDQNCSVNCKDNICERSNGSCTHQCNDGYFGYTCGKHCPIGCNGTVCEYADGKCTLGCLTGYFGIKCDQTYHELCRDTHKDAMVIWLPIFTSIIGIGLGVLITWVISTRFLMCEKRNQPTQSVHRDPVAEDVRGFPEMPGEAIQPDAGEEPYDILRIYNNISEMKPNLYDTLHEGTHQN